MTPDTLGVMPNAPKTPLHSFRVDDELWEAAKRRADELGESLADALRRFLRRYALLERGNLEEPTELGTVIEISNGRLWVRVEPDPEQPDFRWQALGDISPHLPPEAHHPRAHAIIRMRWIDLAPDAVQVLSDYKVMAQPIPVTYRQDAEGRFRPAGEES